MDLGERLTGLKEFFGFASKKPSKRETPQKADRVSLRALEREQPGETEEKPHIRKDENVADFLVRSKEAFELQEDKEGKFNYAKAGFEAIRDRRRQRDIEKYGDNWYGRMWKHLLETDSGISILMGGRAVLGASSIAVAATLLRGDAAYVLGPALYAFGTAEYANAMLRGTLYFGENRMRMLARAARRETKAVLRGLQGKDRFEPTDKNLTKIYEKDQESMDADKKLKAKETKNNLIAFGVPKAIAAAMFVHLRAPVPLGWHDFDGQDLPPAEQFHRVWLDLKTGGMHYVRELGGGITEMGKPIWRDTEEAAKFVYGSAAWGTAAGIFADLPEKIATSVVTVGKKTLTALEKILGRKPTPKDIEKIRVKPIKGATKKTAKFQSPQASEELGDISQRIIDRAQAWFKEHPLEADEESTTPPAPSFPGSPTEPPRVPVAGVRAAPTGDLRPHTTVKLTKEEKEALGLLKPVPAQTMKENLEKEELWQGVPGLAEKEELSDTDRKENAASIRARIFQAIGLASESQKGISYRDFNKRLKEFVASDGTDTEQLQALKEFLGQHTDDLVGEAGAPVLMWADRRHLEKMIDKRLPAELPHIPPEPAVAPGTPPTAPTSGPVTFTWPDFSFVQEDSDRLAKEAEDEAQPLDVMPEHLLSKWDAPTAESEDELTLEGLLAGPLDRMKKDEEAKASKKKHRGSPIDDVRTRMAGDAARLREIGDRHGTRYPAARTKLRALLLNRLDPAVLEKLHKGIWTTENIDDPHTKKLAREIEGVGRLTNRDVADRLLQEFRMRVAPKIDLQENQKYQKVFSDLVTNKKFSDSQGISFRVDESEEYVYRGSDPRVLQHVGTIVSRGRLNVELTSSAIKRLDVLSKELGFVYRVGRPTSATSPAENRDSVTIYFPNGPTERAMSALSDFAVDDEHKRGRVDDLYGKRINGYFYLSEDFAKQLPQVEGEKLLAALQRTNRQLYEVVSGYVGDGKEISERQFHVVKEFLAAFGLPIQYNKEKGIVYLVPKKKNNSAA